MPKTVVIKRTTSPRGAGVSIAGKATTLPILSVDHILFGKRQNQSRQPDQETLVAAERLKERGQNVDLILWNPDSALTLASLQQVIQGAGMSLVFTDETLAKLARADNRPVGLTPPNNILGISRRPHNVDTFQPITSGQVRKTGSMTIGCAVYLLMALRAQGVRGVEDQDFMFDYLSPNSNGVVPTRVRMTEDQILFSSQTSNRGKVTPQGVLYLMKLAKAVKS